MADNRFYKNRGPFTLADIAKISASFIYAGSVALSNQKFDDVSPLDSAESNHLSFLDNPKYIESFKKSRAGACIIREKFAEKAPSGMALIINENPYFAFAKVCEAFYPYNECNPGVSEKAFISKTAKIGKNCEVESGAFIGENAEIGNDCFIGANSVIGDGVKLGNNCIIKNSVSISHTIIGNNAIINNGANIGQDGFGFAFSNGIHHKVPQIGRVVIGNHVEIGAGTCIDRGSTGDTIIGDGTKIDNLVQIAHNVQIGKGCLITAQVGIAGSTKLGDYVVIGGQAGIAGHLNIGSGTKFAAQSGIAQDVPAGQTYGGYPAVPIRNWHRQSIVLKNLVKKMDTK